MRKLERLEGSIKTRVTRLQLCRTVYSIDIARLQHGRTGSHTQRDSFELGLMSLADQSPCTSWLAQYERTEACRAALALDVSG